MAPVAKKYQFAVIAVDIAVFTVEERVVKVLLIKMKKHPFEICWALPGGLIRPNESLDVAASRILREKTALKGIYLEQIQAFGSVKRDPFGRVVSVAYLVLISSDKFNVKTTEEHSEIAWYAVDKLPPLAYDHREITKVAYERLKMKLQESTIVYSLLPQEFTLSDLQTMYEIILGRKLDKRNFRRKIFELGLLQRLHKKRVGMANRPAELYAFAKHGYQKIDIL
ncbi:MAG: NUDIX hydrolase [Parcubacteria group bacterium Gr01-1014_70]|nr:MAG: NUDIX hydrolase [Parcubacteria group bacterium Gr01-1014_70]